MASTLDDLVNRAAFVSAEAQLKLEEVVGSSSWTVDFSDQPTLTWGEQPSAIIMTPSLIGTVSTKAGTWHWGWDNINDFPEAVVADAKRVKAKAREIAEVQTAELALEGVPHLPVQLILAAKAITGTWAHYAASAGPATDVWMLLDAQELKLGEPSALKVGPVIAQALSTAPVTDHGAALRYYAELRGFRVKEDGAQVILFASDGHAIVTFENEQIVDINLELGAKGVREGVPVPAMEPASVEAAERAEPGVAASPTLTEPVSSPLPDEAAVPTPEGESGEAEEERSGLEEAPVDPTDLTQREETPDASSAPGPTHEQSRSEAPCESSLEQSPDEEAEASAKREPEKKEKKGFFAKLFGR
ncbi:MAG: hypothetical protein Q4P36_06595 [Bowdeniella nasicola]|nr:hypothetical protein [Bowdeniella nasicola]